MFNKKFFSIYNSDDNTHKIIYFLGIKIKYKTGNKIIFMKNGKQVHKFFRPRGLKLVMNGSNNTVILEMPISFSNTKISLVGNNNKVHIKTTSQIIADAVMFIEDGSELFIDENSGLGQGDFYLVANGNYKEKHKIVIGKNFRAARDTIIRTSDGHSLIDPETNLAINEPKDIIIGDNVWVMSRCMIAKGAKIPDGSAVAAYSFVNKPFEEKNILLAGIPAKILKHNIRWNISSYGSYMRSMEENIKE